MTGPRPVSGPVMILVGAALSKVTPKTIEKAHTQARQMAALIFISRPARLYLRAPRHCFTNAKRRIRLSARLLMARSIRPRPPEQAGHRMSLLHCRGWLFVAQCRLHDV